MQSELDPLERLAMDMLLAGDDPTLKILREQFRVTAVLDRKLTGVGFFVTFSVPPGARRIEGKKLSYLGDVKAEIKGLQHGADFVLHFRDGAIDYLEGCSYDEPWPAGTESCRVAYIDGEERDLATLWTKWAGWENAPGNNSL